MSGNNRKLFDNLVSRTKIYLVIIFILLVIVSILKPNLIVPSLVIYILILGYTYFANNKRKSEISEQLQDLTLTVDSAAKTSLINAPFPLIIIETDGNVVWKSLKFATEFANVDINTYINDLIIDIKAEIEKDKIYRMVWAEHVTDDILSHAEDIGAEISKEDAEILAESYACDGEYDCNLSYWDNIENLMEDYPKK